MNWSDFEFKRLKSRFVVYSW